MSEQTLKQKTANGLLWGGIMNGAQQVLNLAFGIFLARCLSASDYGLVGMLTIFALIATALQESGFISALNRKKEATAADFNAVFWFNVLCSTAVYLLLFAAAPLIAEWFRQPLLVPLARVSFLSFVISSLNTAPRAWLFRHMKVRETALLSVGALFTSGLTGVILAWQGFAYWAIVVQNLTFCTMLTLGSCGFCNWRPSCHIYLLPLRSMIGFSSRLLATNIFTHINNNLFSIVFGRLYGEQTVGYYNQANKWTGMGHTLLTGMLWSVTQPLFARLSEETDERKQRVFRKMLRLTAFLSCPALFGLALVAGEFITIAITDKWLPSAHLMQWLCVGGAFLPIAALYSNFVVSQGHSQVYMWNTLAQCLVQMLLMALLHPYGVDVMVWAYVVANTLWLLVWHRFVRRLIGLRLRDALRDVVPFVLLAAASMALAWGVAALLDGSVYVSLAVKVFVAAAAYVASLRLLGAQIMAECLDFAKEKLHLKTSH